MAHGLYGKLSPAAGAWEKLTTSAVPAGKIRTVTVEASNNTATPTQIWIAYSTAAAGGDIDPEDIKTPGRTLEANKEYGRSHQMLAAGENVWVKSSEAGIGFDVRGVEGSDQ